MSTEPLKTPAEWCEELGARIVDHDGWRGADAPPWHQPITREEFDRRLIVCTIDGRGYPDFLGNHPHFEPAATPNPTRTVHPADAADTHTTGAGA